MIIAPLYEKGENFSFKFETLGNANLEMKS